MSVAHLRTEDVYCLFFSTAFATRTEDRIECFAIIRTKMSLPAGYPGRVTGPLAWSGKEFDATPEVFEETLDALDICEIEEATRQNIS